MLDQYIDKSKTVSYYKQDAQSRKNDIVYSLKNNNIVHYTTFAICTSDKDQSYLYNIDAMMASQVVSKPTVNGYSGTCIGVNCDFISNLDTISLYKYLNYSWISKNKVLVIQK